MAAAQRPPAGEGSDSIRIIHRETIARRPRNQGLNVVRRVRGPNDSPYSANMPKATAITKVTLVAMATKMATLENIVTPA